MDGQVRRGTSVLSVHLLGTPPDLQENQESQVKWDRQVQSVFQDLKVSKGSKGCEELLVLRAPLVSPVSQDPRAPRVIQASCRGLGRKGRMVPWGHQDQKESRGQMRFREDQDPEVSQDRRETRDPQGIKGTRAHLEHQASED